jgi:hypothetical protein
VGSAVLWSVSPTSEDLENWNISISILQALVVTQQAICYSSWFTSQAKRRYYTLKGIDKYDRAFDDLVNEVIR